jgi:hypothetical protein
MPVVGLNSSVVLSRINLLRAGIVDFGLVSQLGSFFITMENRLIVSQLWKEDPYRNDRCMNEARRIPGEMDT